MEAIKSKAIKNLEQRMQDLNGDSLRYHVLESAKNFKSSWLELGRSLYSVWKDKLYKEWGYNSFDNYSAREIGIRKQTAMKLLRSYYFLEKEEPGYIKEDYLQGAEPSKVPSFESVDVLRMAKNKKTLDKEDYENLKKDIFEKGKDFREVRKDLTSLIRSRQELEPEEAQERKRTSTVRRFIGTLKAIKQEMEILKLLPAPLVKEVSSLIEKLERELS
ncbi:MAG: hypothetical protein WC628_09615 [Candidatus Omnitrophota bacterium]